MIQALPVHLPRSQLAVVLLHAERILEALHGARQAMELPNVSRALHLAGRGEDYRQVLLVTELIGYEEME